MSALNLGTGWWCIIEIETGRCWSCGDTTEAECLATAARWTEDGIECVVHALHAPERMAAGIGVVSEEEGWE